MNKKQQQNKQPAVPVAAGWAKQSRSLKMPSHLTTSLHYPVKCLTDNSPMVRFSAQYTRPSHGPAPPLHAPRPAADRFLVSRHVGKVLQTCNGHRQHMAPVSNGRPCARLGRCSGEGEGGSEEGKWTTRPSKLANENRNSCSSLPGSHSAPSRA